MSLWCLAKAPLLIGTDLSQASNDTIRILGNRDCIAVNQDSLGKPGRLLQNTTDVHTWGGPLSDGWAAVVLNIGDVTHQGVLDFTLLGIPSNQTVVVRDLWAHQDLG